MRPTASLFADDGDTPSNGSVAALQNSGYGCGLIITGGQVCPSHFGEATNEKYPYYRSATLFRLWKPADDPNFEEAMRGLLATFCIAGIIATFCANAAAEHPGWFVRVCPAKTEANRVHLTFSGGRQGFTWSWIRGRTLDEMDLPRRFHSVPRVFIRAVAASTPSNLQPHAYVCVGFRDHIVQRMEFDDHENHQKNWNDTDDCAC